MKCISAFDEVWLVDFEFHSTPGERPAPLCLVAVELKTGRRFRHWLGYAAPPAPPYTVGPHSLIVAFYAPAEMSCHLALGWPFPANLLDLFTEFRNRTNGLAVPYGNSLLGALAYFGLPTDDAVVKEAMRALAQRGGPYSADERSQLLAYCESDVRALQRLFERMRGEFDFGRALLRGRFMAAVATMEWNGIPIDLATLRKLESTWANVQNSLVSELDPDGHFFVNGRFDADGFDQFLKERRIAWPRLASGRLELNDDTFSDMAKVHPCIRPVQDIRKVLGKMKPADLAVGRDGRNRSSLSAFRSKTGRNQPSSSSFVFGRPAWWRNLIRPEPGWGLAYIDWCQQEFGVAAALSGDVAMMRAYSSGDPYLSFAKQAGAVPEDATKKSHPAHREQFKLCALGVLFSMGADSLATYTGRSRAHATNLLDLHHRTFPAYWRWSDAAVERMALAGALQASFGWTLHSNPDMKERSVRNFPMQSNGAEMMRLAAIYATAAGIRVCAPIHDAFLIEAPLEILDSQIELMRRLMARASSDVLRVMELTTDVQKVLPPKRLSNQRGAAVWASVVKILGVRC